MRLALTTDETDGFVTFAVERVGRDAFDGRPIWRWSITADGTTWSDDDLRGAPTYPRALGDLLSFASACAEAWGLPDSENRGLFPPACADVLASVGSDALALYGEVVEGEADDEAEHLG